MSDLRFEDGNGREIGRLLEEHDTLHRRLMILDAEDHTAAQHELMNDLIRTNVAMIVELVGLPGVRGLVHVAHEALDTIGHVGLELDQGGGFRNPRDGQAWLDLAEDVKELSELMTSIAMSEGKLGDEHYQDAQHVHTD